VLDALLRLAVIELQDVAHILWVCLVGACLEPTRSTKRTETSFRSSCGGAASVSAAPQPLQKRASGAFMWPQLGHLISATAMVVSLPSDETAFKEGAG
jgi:hypothetical protein